MAAICIRRWSIFANLPVSSLCCPERAADDQQSDRLLDGERRRKFPGVLQSGRRVLVKDLARVLHFLSRIAIRVPKNDFGALKEAGVKSAFV
jgi:hypothetical protein